MGDEPGRAGRFPKVQIFIDPDECIDCGACVAECPVAAIYLDDGVPSEHRENIERNAKFFVADRYRRCSTRLWPGLEHERGVSMHENEWSADEDAVE